MCAGAIGWARVGRLVYGASDPKKGFSLLKGNILHPKTKIESGILEEECSRVLTEFFKEKRQ
jgi:tRNA(adenine34) deaminase